MSAPKIDADALIWRAVWDYRAGIDLCGDRFGTPIRRQLRRQAKRQVGRCRVSERDAGLLVIVSERCVSPSARFADEREVVRGGVGEREGQGGLYGPSGPPSETVLPTYSRVLSASRMKRATSARAIDEGTEPEPTRAV